MTLNGTASSHPDGDPLSFVWKDENGSVVGTTAIVTPTVPPDTHTFTLTVNDGHGGTASASVVITVQALCDGDTVVVDENVVVDFNPATPTCSDGVTPDLCKFFTFDKPAGTTPDKWKATFDVGAKKILVKAGATIQLVGVPSSGNNQKSPGIVIRSTCHLDIEPGGAIVVNSVNQPAGDILIQVDGGATINGSVRNQVSGTLGTPGKITIASCCGDIVTGPTSRIETIGVDPGGSDINLSNCCGGGNISISGLVRANHKSGVIPTINIVSFQGGVNIDGNNDFGTEVVGGTTIRRTSGVVVETVTATEAGTIKIQAQKDITILGNHILNRNQLQYGAVAVKPHSTNGQGGQGIIEAVSLGGRIVAFDRAFDFENRFNALNAITLFSKADIQLTASINDGATDNTKAVASSQGGDTGQGGKNTLRSFSGGVVIGQKAQVLADFTGRPGANGANLLTSCSGVFNSGAVIPADQNTGDDAGVCTPVAPTPFFNSCETDFGIKFNPNQPPLVNAGPDLTLQLPNKTATLQGTVSDDGLPAGGTLTSSGPRSAAPARSVSVHPPRLLPKQPFPLPALTWFV